MKKEGKFIGILVLSAVVFLGVNTLISQSKHRSDFQKSEGISFIQAAAYKYGVLPEDLAVINAKWEKLPLTGEEVFRAKVYDTKREKIYGIALDNKDNIVNFSSLKEAENKAFNNTYGKLTPTLHQMVQSLSAEDTIPVAIWLKVDQSRIPKRDVPEDQAMEDLKFLIEQTEADLKFELFTRGIIIDYASPLAPLIYAKVKRSDLDGWLSEREDIQRIYDATNINEDHLNYQTKASRIWKVWDRGITGSGVTVAIIEDSRIDFNNTCLPNNAGTRVPGDANVDHHATTCGGMVGSSHSTYKGAAYGASIYSSNGTDYTDANMSAALDAAASNAKVLNNSWGPNCGSGSLNIHARHADYIVRHSTDVVVASAGNNGDISNCEYVDGVAAGYNVIAVGSYNDNHTGLWSDDSMSSFSSYLDPQGPSESYTHEKPEVAAPGEDPSTGYTGFRTYGIYSLNMTPPAGCPTGGVGYGTSYSSPIAAGVAALAIQRNSTLNSWPETVKALLMCNAIHNIEGSTRLSEYDGAGGVNGKKTDKGAKKGYWDYEYLTESDFGSKDFIYFDLPPITQAGRKVRAVICWDTNPAADYSTDPLEQDLDLELRFDGVTKTWSSSYSNGFEIVEYTATAPVSKVKLRVHKYRFDAGTTTYLGVAWGKF